MKNLTASTAPEHHILRTMIGMTAWFLLAAIPMQSRVDRSPTSFQRSVQSLARVEKLEFPATDIARMRVEDAADEASGEPVAMRFAASLPVAIESTTSGTWETLPDSSRVWRLRILSPQALSLNLFLDRYRLPKASAIWIYSPDGSQIHGAFGPDDAKGDGELWTPIVRGDELVIEMYVPAASEFEPEIRIASIQHGYRHLIEGFEKQGSCNIDVICPEGNAYRDQIRAVGFYSIEGIRVCTGTMVNNTEEDFKPYFLTADHCGLSSNNASSVVVYWNHESPTCGALSGGSLEDIQTGSTFLASYDDSDFALIELDRMPDFDWKVYWAGWDARDLAALTSVGIHHPQTDEKAISFNENPLISDDIRGVGVETHWKVDNWELGTTEPGSSGSCIFDQTSRLCVGTLTGGYAACGNDEADWYGKFSEHWTGGGNSDSRLSDWLDTGHTGADTLAGSYADRGTVPPAKCIASDTVICLNKGRFQVELVWTNFRDESGPGRNTGVGSNDSGLLWFFASANWEMLVKVLDGCGINNHYWVFASAATNVEYTLRVIDTQTGHFRLYSNPLGNNAPALTDTEAFTSCP